MVLEGFPEEGWCSLEERCFSCVTLVPLGGAEEVHSLLWWVAVVRQACCDALAFEAAQEAT